MGLVTDLRKLNEVVIPDTSIFPTPARMMTQVNPASTWFVAVDLLSGYHQVAIKEEDKQYFAFMIDEGKQGGVFVYTSAPMGYCNSGHSFVNNLSLLLADLDVLSEVDDILIEGSTVDEVLQKFELLLIRCRKYNIKISRRKVQFGESVRFAGLTLGEENGYKPFQEKCQAIMDLAPPTSAKEVRSFLGMANGFRNFLPRMSHSLENIRKLLAKDAVYLWQDCHQKEFDDFKRALTGLMGLRPFDIP